MGLVLRQFLAEGGCNAFIVGDDATGAACLIDPRADQLPLYEAALAALGFKPSFVIDTHTHADHYSGSHLVARAFGSRIAMSERTGSKRADVRLVDGQRIEIGSSLEVRAIATPGHTPDSVSLIATNGRDELAFTGDTLFIGGSGRVDFPGSDAGEQYDSIHGRLGALADSAWVYPGHDYSGLLFSTVGFEKKTNPHWLLPSKDEFVRMKKAELIDAPCLIPTVVNFNLDQNPRSTPRAGSVTLCATVSRSGVTAGIDRLSPEQWESKMAEMKGEARFFDVREAEELVGSGLVEGVEHLPLGGLALRWNELRSAKAVYFMCDLGKRSLLAAETLHRLGVTSVGDLAGGLGAWLLSGRRASGARTLVTR